MLWIMCNFSEVSVPYFRESRCWSDKGSVDPVLHWSTGKDSKPLQAVAFRDANKHKLWISLRLWVSDVNAATAMGFPSISPWLSWSQVVQLVFYHESRRGGEGRYLKDLEISHPVCCQGICAIYTFLLLTKRRNPFFPSSLSLPAVAGLREQSDHYPQLSCMINYSICPVRSYNEEVLIKIANYHWQQS